MGLFDAIGSAVSGVVNTVEHAAGGIVGDVLGGGLGGGIAQIGEGLLGQALGGLTGGIGGDAFGVLKNVAGGLLGEITGNHGANNCPTAPTNPAATGADGSTGGSIFDKIFALLAKLQDKLGQKMDDASKIDPSNQAGLQKAMFEVQQIQSQMQELVTTATNLQKTEHDTQMSEVRNFA